MDRRLRAARDGGIVVAVTVLAVIWEGTRHPEFEILPADVTLTEPVERGTDQLQFLVRGAGCDRADTSPRDYRKPKDRIKAPVLQYYEDRIVITYKLDDPGQYACTGEDPGVPKTLTLRLPLGNRTILDGTKNPPAPFKTGPPRTLPLGAIPDPAPTPTPKATATPSHTSA